MTEQPAHIDGPETNHAAAPAHDPSSVNEALHSDVDALAQDPVLSQETQSTPRPSSEEEQGPASEENLTDPRFEGWNRALSPEEYARYSDEARARRVKREVDSSPLHGIEGRFVYRFAKRAFDIIFSLFVLVCFCWLFAIVAIIIKSDDPSAPVIFRQKRIGYRGNTFTMFKFRTMCVDAEKRLEALQPRNEKALPVFKIAEDPRVTKVGKKLRQFSLDELPQFVNVLRGDISVVGPRPALPREVACYDERQRQRFLVKGGITCFWQTRRNRDLIPFDEWVDLDLLYVKKCGFWTDIKLILQTIGVVLTAQGS